MRITFAICFFATLAPAAAVHCHVFNLSGDGTAPNAQIYYTPQSSPSATARPLVVDPGAGEVLLDCSRLGRSAASLVDLSTLGVPEVCVVLAADGTLQIEPWLAPGVSSQTFSLSALGIAVGVLLFFVTVAGFRGFIS